MKGLKLVPVLFIFALVVVVISIEVPAAESDKALVNGDYVRVRTEPTTAGAHVSFLYKNMVVAVTNKTTEKVVIGKDSDYWYEIKTKDIHGWVFGKFLAFDVANWDVNTYDAPGDMQWFYNRFGESTWYYGSKVTMQSFSMDDYRNLMQAAEKGGEQAWVALRHTILLHLYQNPNATDYAYLRQRLYSKEFLQRIATYPFAYNDPRFFDVIPYDRSILAVALKHSPTLAQSMPKDYWEDKEVVMLVLKHRIGCNGTYTKKVSEKLRQDVQIKKILEGCKTRR